KSIPPTTSWGRRRARASPPPELPLLCVLECRFGGGRLSGALVFETVALDFTIERREVDAEDLRGLDLVAADFVEDAPHVFALEFLERHPGGFGGCTGDRRGVEFLGEVVGVDDV